MLIFTVIFAANIKKQSIILYTMKQKLNDSQNKPSRYKKLNVFETFSGIGSQHKALKNAFKPDKFDIIATSEWEIYAIIAYDAIHHGPVSKQALKDLLNRGGLFLLMSYPHFFQNSLSPKMEKNKPI